MPVGSIPCFPCVPGGWKAAESSNRDTLPHALHGKSSEIKGFVCTANNKDFSQFVTCQRRREILSFFKLQLMQLLQI